MKNNCGWPSRKVQITFLAVLAAIMMASVCQDYLSMSKADRLYEQAWLRPSGPYAEEGNQDAIERLKAALKISPDNSLYQQALIWKTPPQEMAHIVKDYNLTPEAKRLYVGLTLTLSEDTRKGKLVRPRSLSERLRISHLLKEADSKNPFAYYEEAAALSDAGRYKEAYQDVYTGNRMGIGHLYVPEVSPSVRNSLSSPKMRDAAVMQIDSCRRAAFGVVKYSEQMVRQHNDKEASDVIHECLRMSMSVSQCTPLSTMSMLTGTRLFFSHYWRHTRISDRLRDKSRDSLYDKISEVLQKNSKAMATFMSSDDEQSGTMQSMLVRYSILGGALFGVVLSAMLGMLAGLWYIACSSAVRKKQQAGILLDAWGEGWVTRLCLKVYVPIFALLGGFVYIIMHLHGIAADFDAIAIGFAVPSGLIILGQTITLVRMIAQARKSLAESMKDKTDAAASVLSGRASRRAWVTRSIAAGLAVNAAFLTCLLMISIIGFKPMFGNEPWEVGKTQYFFIKIRERVLKACNSDLQEVLPAEWRYTE